jgi:acetolactate decarboxylase
MAILNCNIPSSILEKLQEIGARDTIDVAHLVTMALSQFLGEPIHTLFQVSTSGALVAGRYEGIISAETILRHGDFGLGTFANLDGEMVVLDGSVYQVKGTGEVLEAAPDAAAPFAIVTRFAPQVEIGIDAVATFSDLERHCDALRQSGNIFYAFRLDGHFDYVRTRVVNPPQDGAGLLDAAKAQSEFRFTDVDGTLVGLWSPGFSSAFSVAGYHFHFISNDRQHGGHLLDCRAGPLELKLEALTDFHLALPETESFLKADLSKNVADELAYAERAH